MQAGSLLLRVCKTLPLILQPRLPLGLILTIFHAQNNGGGWAVYIMWGQALFPAFCPSRPPSLPDTGHAKPCRDWGNTSALHPGGFFLPGWRPKDRWPLVCCLMENLKALKRQHTQGACPSPRTRLCPPPWSAKVRGRRQPEAGFTPRFLQKEQTQVPPNPPLPTPHPTKREKVTPSANE